MPACRAGDAEETVRRLRAEMAAKAAELREVRAAEQEAAEDCERLSRDLAAERLRAKVGAQLWKDAIAHKQRSLSGSAVGCGGCVRRRSQCEIRALEAV